MPADALVEEAVRVLLRSNGSGIRVPDLGQSIRVVAEHLRRTSSVETAENLQPLSDDLKVLIVQQYFQHVSTGSHKTDFDRQTVSFLLRQWFGVELNHSHLDQRFSPPQHLPGRPEHSEICHLDFGGTDIFFYASDNTRRAAKSLISLIERDLTLTVDKTSPPCELSEFVPLWLRDRERAPSDYYLRDQPDYTIEHYFQDKATTVSEDLGIDIRDQSSEMAIIANGDALRYHRDRLVNQYAYLNGLDSDLSDYRLVQNLTLIDWDMQDTTISGTVLDHINGDRYIFPLYPGEVSSVLFCEDVRPPGPMMMPYHCALPVLDNSARFSVGAAKGKRLSTLIRGTADAAQVDDLREQAQELDINNVVSTDESFRQYRNGFIVGLHPLADAVMKPHAFIENDQGLSITELDASANSDLISHALEDATSPRLFRIEKYSAGFSDVCEAIPGFRLATQAVIIARTANRSAAHRFPVTLDFTQHGLPWLQMFDLPTGSFLICPRSARGLVRLTPPDEILHRSAILDSFYPSTTTQARMVNCIDIILAEF